MTNLLIYLTFAVTTNWTSWNDGDTHKHGTGMWYLTYTMREATCEHLTRGGESGVVTSNVTAWVVLDGKTNQLVVSSETLGTIKREWTNKVERVQQPDMWEKPWVPNGWNYFTNSLDVTNRWKGE